MHHGFSSPVHISWFKSPCRRRQKEALQKKPLSRVFSDLETEKKFWPFFRRFRAPSEAATTKKEKQSQGLPHRPFFVFFTSFSPFSGCKTSPLSNADTVSSAGGGEGGVWGISLGSLKKKRHQADKKYPTKGVDLTFATRNEAGKKSLCLRNCAKKGKWEVDRLRRTPKLAFKARAERVEKQKKMQTARM